MARKSRYRRYRRGRWSSNITELNNIQLSFENGISSQTATLVTNPVQSNLSTSQVYTIKNVELNFLIDAFATSSLAGLDNINVYIMFVPQGMNVSSDYNLQHPEYIMAHRMQGGPTADSDQKYQPLKIKTRLARRLNTGDSIIVFIKAHNDTETVTCRFSGLIKCL